MNAVLPFHKSKCDDNLKIHLPSVVKEQLSRRAQKNGREMSDYCRGVLVRHLIVECALENMEGYDWNKS